MRGNAVRLSALGNEPPTEILLFKTGKNDTENGTFYLTTADAKECVAAFKRYGNDLSIDYGHGVTKEDDGVPRRAAGWIASLEARPDGLWAVGVSWTDLATQMIRNREQRFTSPYFLTDDKGHITQILNVALTMIPATRDLMPLVAHRHLTKRVAMAKMVKAEDVHAHADKIGELAEQMDSAKMKKLSEDMHTMASAGKEIPEDAADGGADDAEENPDGTKKKASDEASGEAVAASAEAAKSPAVAEALAALAALSRVEAAPSPVAAAVTSTSDDAAIGRLAREVTGKTNPSEVHGVLLALEQSRGEQKKLLGRVSELETRLRKADVTEAVRLATKAGKLRFAQREWAVKLGMADPDSLRAFIEESPIVQTIDNAPRTATSEADAIRAEASKLSADEEKMIKIAGISRDSFIAARSAQG